MPNNQEMPLSPVGCGSQANTLEPEALPPQGVIADRASGEEDRSLGRLLDRLEVFLDEQEVVYRQQHAVFRRPDSYHFEIRSLPEPLPDDWDYIVTAWITVSREQIAGFYDFTVSHDKDGTRATIFSLSRETEQITQYDDTSDVLSEEGVSHLSVSPGYSFADIPPDLLPSEAASREAMDRALPVIADLLRFGVLTLAETLPRTNRARNI